MFEKSTLSDVTAEGVLEPSEEQRRIAKQEAARSALETKSRKERRMMRSDFLRQDRKRGRAKTVPSKPGKPTKFEKKKNRRAERSARKVNRG